MTSRTLLLVALAVAGCGSDDAPVELDAGIDATDAMVIDGDRDSGIDAAAVECIPGAGPMHPPTAGTYCTTWLQVDGPDAFPRYYDRVDVTTTGVTWRSSGGKEYNATASVTGGCLLVAGFTANGGAMRSDPITLCWSSEPRACGSMTWKQPPLADGHWSVQLDACP